MPKSVKDEYNLSAKRRAILEALLAHPGASGQDIADVCGTTREYVYKCRNLVPEFKEAYKKELDKQWREARGIAQDTLIDLSKNGDRQASQYILDSLGLGAIQKIDANVTNKVITVTVDDD